MRARWAFLLFLGACLGVLLFLRPWRLFSPRTRWVIEWLQRPEAHPEWRSRALVHCNQQAPFLFPTEGYIGYLWDDSFRLGHRHQGIDIFGGGAVGETPVYAAYDGYLTRLPQWKSSLILRLPEDPLAPGRQIWLYYTHLADREGNSLIQPDFPAGTYERFVAAGTLLGYQGNYSGDPLQPVGVHLHFSIVLDDGHGHFRNELDIRNTLDPSPYFGLPLNGQKNRNRIVVCTGEP
jgi:murein DD-endopeptidase MepM/ murein hydrolase activator NlpD